MTDSRRIWWLPVVALVAAACGSSSTGPTIKVSSAVDSGDFQIASPSRRLDFPLVLILKDSLGHPIHGAGVAFVVGGGGSVTVPNATSDVSGRVSTAWTLGSSGAQTVTATSDGFSHVFHAEIVPVTNSATFQIVVVNVGAPFSPAVQAAFDSAAAFWTRAITGQLSQDSIGTDALNPPIMEGDSGCGAGFPAVGPLRVDQVVIMARVDSIDGPGKIVGEAGPCAVRVSNTGVISPTILGGMAFDSADIAGLVAANQFHLVIKHEMAHVLGFGTFWPTGSFGSISGRGCLQQPTTSAPGPDTYYNCANGLAYFDSIGGTSYTLGNKVPVENCDSIPGGSPCGNGTWNSHWREAVFNNELMTGYLNSGANPVSKLTIAQFKDMGYTGVDVSQAEAYSQTFTAPSAFRVARLYLGNDARMPRFAKRSGEGVVRIGAVQ